MLEAEYHWKQNHANDVSTLLIVIPRLRKYKEICDK